MVKLAGDVKKLPYSTNIKSIQNSKSPYFAEKRLLENWTYIFIESSDFKEQSR
jgi:hypothetical protein